MEWVPIIVAYAAGTSLVVLGAVLAFGSGGLKSNPLAYVFWPVIAPTACIVTVKRMWREG